MAFDFPNAPALNDEYTSGGVTYQFNGVGWVPIAAMSVVGARTQPQGRLTLANLTPVMPASVLAAASIYYSGYVGDEAPLFDGSTWSMVALPGGQLGAALNDTIYSPAPIGASKCNDWFYFRDPGGAIRLSHGPDWTNDTTRSAGSVLVRQNGLWLNSAAITKGPAPLRGTWIGTTRSNAAGTLDWMLGGAAPTGVALLLSVWNAYNRVSTAAVTSDTQDHTVSMGAAVFTESGTPNTRITFVTGMAEDALYASYQCPHQNSATGYALVAVGLDGAAQYGAGAVTGYISASYLGTAQAHYRGTVLGAHRISAMEAAANCMFGGNFGVVNGIRPGLSLQLPM
jgi:hypothetical protein